MGATLSLFAAFSRIEFWSAIPKHFCWTCSLKTVMNYKFMPLLAGYYKSGRPRNAGVILARLTSASPCRTRASGLVNEVWVLVYHTVKGLGLRV